MLAVQRHPTMTRLPSDSFLPCGGALDDTQLSFSSLRSDSSFVISPLSLPRGSAQYIDGHATAPRISPPSSGPALAPAISSSRPTRASASLLHANSAALTNGTGHSWNSTRNNNSNIYSPSGSLRGMPREAQHPGFVSPRLAPTSTQLHHQIQQEQRRQQQQRSASLSPTRRAACLTGPSLARARSAVASPSREPQASCMPPLDASLGVNTTPGTAYPAGNDALAASAPASGSFNLQSPVLQSRSVSIDSAGASIPSVYAQRITLLEKQNSLVRQAWEDERRHLEANRKRAEEVYQEERALMDLERDQWEADRGAMMAEIGRLREAVRTLRVGGRFHQVGSIPEEEGLQGASLRGGGDNGQSSRSGRTSSVSSQQGMSQQGQTSQQSQQFRQFQQARPSQEPQSAAFQSEQPHASISSSKQLESSPFNPLSQQSDPLPSQSESLIQQQEQEQVASSSSSVQPDTMPPNDDSPVPIIDVQDIHPELEGIPLKKTTVEKPTFTDGETKSPSHCGSRSPSAMTSPPLNPSTAPDVSLPGVQVRKPSEQTLQVLAAPETERLTMHAGHTPSHSLSVLPSAAATVAPTTASSSGEVTPTTVSHADAGILSDGGGDLQSGEQSEGLLEPPATGAGTLLDPPEEDRPLRGPLMIRNQPANDEIFLRRLSEKLEDVKNGEDAVPAVLRDSPGEGPSTVDGTTDAGAPPAGAPPAENQESSNDDSRRSSHGSSRSDDRGLDIPLRIRKTSNFGAPLGEMRNMAH